VAIVEIAKMEITKGQKKLNIYHNAVKQKVSKLDLLSCFIEKEHSTTKIYKDVLVGNEAFVFGYPTSIGLKEIPQINYIRPLLRKGTIAGKNDKMKTIILDCPTYYGNSGGPVVEVERIGAFNTQFRVIGLISQFVPFAEIWINATQKYSYKQLSNSGYTIVIPIDFVIELINQKNN